MSKNSKFSELMSACRLPPPPPPCLERSLNVLSAIVFTWESFFVVTDGCDDILLQIYGFNLLMHTVTYFYNYFNVSRPWIIWNVQYLEGNGKLTFNCCNHKCNTC